MEPPGVAGPMLELTSDIFSLPGEPSKLYDTALSWRPLLSKKENFFLQIFDIPLSTGKPSRTFLKVGDTEDLDHAMRGMPAQAERTIRVFFVGFSPSRGGPVIRFIMSDSASITSQWSPSSQQNHWEIDCYKFSLKTMLRGYDARSYGARSYIDSVSIAAGTIRQTMKCEFKTKNNGRIIWYIDVESMVQNVDLLFDANHLRKYALLAEPTPEAVYAYHRQFCKTLRSLIEAYSNMFAQLRLASGRKQFLLLLYSHAVLDDYRRQVYHLQADYARRREGLSDPRRAKLTSSMLAEITRDACFYKEVNERVVNLAGAIDALVEALKLQVMDAAEFRKFQSLAVDLQSTCTDLKRIMATLSATFENHLRLFEISRGIHDAQNVGLLSILASVFLPLSLATGLLSMQTRFTHLHYLLYDFFGVLVLLGSIVIAILIILRIHLWWKELLLQLGRNAMFRKHIRPIGFTAFLCFFFLVWALLLSSFLIGMIRDVGLGLKVLGYGVAAAVGIGGPPTLLCLLGVGVVFVRVKASRRRRRLRQARTQV